MGWPLYAILTGIKWATGNFKSHIDSIRTFQELYATSSLGMFVSLNSDSNTGREQLMYEMDIAIKAHIFLTPAPFIYNLYWGEIFGTPQLRGYFQQYKSWHAFLKKRLAKREWWEYLNVTDDLLVILTGYFKRYTTFKSSIELMAHPWMYSMAIRDQFKKEDAARDENHKFTFQHLLQKVQAEQEKIEQPLILEQLVRFFHPVIDMEWVIIKNAIITLYTYDMLMTRHPEGLRAYRKPVPFVRGQRYRFYQNAQEKEWTAFTEGGRVTKSPAGAFTNAAVLTDAEIEQKKAEHGEAAVSIFELDSHGVRSEKLCAWFETIYKATATLIDVTSYGPFCAMYTQKFDGYSTADIHAMYGLKYDAYTAADINAAYGVLSTSYYDSDVAA